MGKYTISSSSSSSGSINSTHKIRFPSSDTSTDSPKSVPPKQGWDNKYEYFLSCVSYGVGLGNLWRFPYLCFQHGGLTFLIPYWICMAVCGVPIIVMECLLGQYVGLGAIGTVRSLSPAFEGLAWAQIIMTAAVCVYFNVIVAYALYYLWLSIPKSLDFNLPWSKESAFCANFTSTPSVPTCPEAYYNEVILQRTTPVGDETASDMMGKGLSDVNLYVTVSLLAAWVIV